MGEIDDEVGGSNEDAGVDDRVGCSQRRRLACGCGR